MNRIRQNKAVTLIALVITIVVLIILAAVAINLSLGNNGIFNRAKTAKEQYSNAQEYDIIETSKLSNDIDYYSSNSFISNRNEKVLDYRDNLVCEFTMNNISGGSIIDSSGNNNNAAIVGTGYEQKQENGADYLSLDGTTYAQTSEFTQLNGNNEKTLALWFKTTVTASNYPYIAMLGNDDIEKGGIPPRINNNGYFHFETGCNYYKYSPSKEYLADGKWHFICITHDSNNIAIYIDDKVVYAINAALNTSTAKLTIGCSINTTRTKFTGGITNVRLYSKGLNFEQVYQVYKNTKI